MFPNTILCGFTFCLPSIHSSPDCSKFISCKSSVLSECFSDSSLTSASNFGEVAQLPPTFQQGISNSEAKVRKWVHDGFSAKIPPDLILNNPNHQKYKNSRHARKLAILLARHSFFGERVLGLSSVTGKSGSGGLDSTKLASVKRLIAQLFPLLGAPEFEESVWGSCIQSIRDLCKKLRSQMRQYNLLETAATYEGVTAPID